MLPCRSSVFVCQAIVLLLLLFSSPCQGRATDDQALVQYKVIATPKGNMDLAVVIDDVHMYRMTRVSNDSVLYAVSAPAAAHGYRYTQLNHATQKNETTEAFVRAPRQAGLHEFYGRQWVYRRVKTLPTLKSLPQAYDRRDVDHLHPQNEIPTLHLQASARDIDNLHGYYLQDISIEANATYITAKHTMPFQDVKISLSGRSTRYFSKLSYNLNLPKGGKLDGLIINDRAIGLFLLIERYDDHWLRNEFAAGDKHYANGILYKGDGNIKTKKYKADLSYHGNATAPYEQTSYSVEVEPKQDDKDDNDANNKHKKHKKDKKGNKDKKNKDNQAAAGDKADDKKKKDPAAELGDLIALTKFIDERLQATNNKTALNQTNTLALWNKHFDIDGYFIK
ncbi:hypothetical protein BC940DRAFT_322190 [Gongronella butleri]|nr:hypothetical protein BC940DRAFT_322190 [Gongronella butleri]